MQRQLDVLHTFAQDRGMSVNLGKTKVMIVKTTSQWVRESAPTLTYGSKTLEYTDAYTYLGVVLTSPMLSLKRATEMRLTRA